MKILLAESAGFCFGVKRATKMAMESSAHYHQICSLGPIIHSPQLVKKLEEKGVQVIREVEDIPGGAVIIRSHGVTLDELEAILDRELEVIDATCPFVKKAQQDAEKLSKEGYSVVIVGEEEHPEVQGIVSYARGGTVFVVATPAEAEELPRQGKIGLVAQTTQSFENFSKVVEVCLGKGKELRVFNTICSATAVRQNEARQIAREVDLMLVIGGYNSANTTRLAQICGELQSNTHHVETANDLVGDWFVGLEKVGVTAGASTPRWIIEEVVARVKELGK